MSLRFDDVGFGYRPDQWIVRHCTGIVEPGQVLAILGPNGRGKSTLLKLLLGLLVPREGRVLVDGPVSFVPQLFDVAFDYDALTMVMMGRVRRLSLFAQPGRADQKAALAALDRLGVAALAERPFQQLSGGERQMVMIARALVSDARVLLLDEPTTSLDLRNQATILDAISTLARDERLAIAFTTHQPDQALAYSDHAMLMMPGGGNLAGPSETILDSAHLTNLYDHPVRRGTIMGYAGVIETIVPLYRR